MAVLIGWQFLKFGDRIADGEHWVGETLVPWHVSIGTLLLALIVLRMVWAFSQRGQRPQHEDPQGRLVKMRHPFHPRLGSGGSGDWSYRYGAVPPACERRRHPEPDGLN